MFESRDDALYARVQELEGRVEHLSGLLGALLNDERRYEPRFLAALNTVCQAKSFGHVAVYFVTGRTARMRLLVGPENPPTTSVGYGDHISGIVRPGEFWMAATHRRGLKAGFECVFTPLFRPAS
ncbi:hypothetical protein ALI22I_05230 [Saccharothrix sp. ALI-22-I]|uniref:hypothetical protein n=1 Tax=Saccharothrix sp. ALI-22-I TaxID=1933778 RepID=UPI00097C5FCF|nr:hypothetical protein [Saccharothrix sp. ALI-22-I]ONI92196.1 hypothetical protein ALI22I_05230 [Saccharothrix sp. ALI-22-I]